MNLDSHGTNEGKMPATARETIAKACWQISQYLKHLPYGDSPDGAMPDRPDAAMLY